jgi:hypothetical protein
MKSIFLGVFVFAMTGCVAAGDAADEGALAPGEEPSPAPAPLIAGTVTSSSAARDALAGSDVCLFDQRSLRCTQTNAAGWYEIASLAEDRISASFEKAGHQRARIDVTASRGPLFADVLMIPDADAAAFARIAGREHDPATTGGVVVVAHTTALWEKAPGFGRPIAATVEAGSFTMVLVACVAEHLVAR